MLAPIILALLGLLGGLGVGFVLKPAPEVEEESASSAEQEAEAEEADYEDGREGDGFKKAGDSEYHPLDRKLIAPFKRSNGKSAFVAVDITLEMAPGAASQAQTHEPKIVDAFLRVVVGFAATGAFDDHGHAAHTLRELNRELLKAARAVLGEDVRGVLIANLLTTDN